MRRKINTIQLIVACVTLFSTTAGASTIPIFNLPANDYPVIRYQSIPKTVPVTHLNRKTTPKPVLQLPISGVFSSSKGKYVLINHRIFREGDTVNGYRIIEITNSRVVFKRGKRIYTEKLESTGGIIFYDHRVVSDNESD